tara:strand:- start:558 stop:704 length:147 start_codon:yes stop_codon:yes gene_type:complete
MCVTSMPFISVQGIIGNFEANGIIGLAPNNHERSYVRTLFTQKKIDNM